MELVEGVPLAGPLPVDQAIDYAGQILDALDAAHKKGITHRDLKPANILVTKHGIKLLDFGLAKQTQSPLGDAAQTMQALTTEGQIVGTLQYMAPEQLQGQPTDARADLFAFGCVLYELLSGKRAFDGASPASVIAAILERQPAPLTTHPPLDRVIATCLAKNPDERFQTALDTKRAMRWAMEQPAASAATVAPASRRRERVWMGVAAVAIASVIGIAGWLLSRPGAATTAAPRMQTSVDTPGDDEWREPALSPDGTRIAFVTNSGIVIRAIDSLEGQRITLPVSVSLPAWSPDGQSLAFCGLTKFQSYELHTMVVSGGALRSLGTPCGPFSRGVAWASDEAIIVSVIGRALRVPVAGGKPVSLGEGLFYPTMLPDGRHFVYVRSGAIHVGAIDSDQTSQVTEADSKAEYTSGHLVFMRGTSLLAQPFDASRLVTTGEAFPIAADARISSIARTADFSVAPNGLIVFRTGGVGRTALTWVDRAGKELSVLDESAYHTDVALSPDGRMLAAAQVSPKLLLPNLWVTDLSRGVSTRLTPEGEQVNFPRWSMDGARIAYRSDSRGLSVSNADGSGSSLAITRPAGHFSWFPDGKTMATTDDSGGGGVGKLNTISIDGDRTPVPLLDVAVTQPAISPDGKWMAYAQEESGQFNVFVQSVPIGRGRWRISTAGGAQPLWRRDGRELFYRADDGGVMAVPIAGEGGFSPGVPGLLFRFTAFGLISVRQQFAVSPDGQRFLINRVLPESGRTILLQNWLPQAQR
jgi:Tol biopolymer transport system component